MKNVMKDLLFFEKLITPKFIQFVFWLMLIGVIGGGIGVMSEFSFLFGLLVIVVGAILARIWCELLIVLFKINEALQEIRKK